MDLCDLEKELFSKVETIDYYTTVLNIDGLEHIPVGFYYFREFMDDPKTIGNPVAMQRFYLDTNIFLFWSYGNSADIMGEKVTQLAVDAVTSIGGKVEKVILQRRFKYFPHVSQARNEGWVLSETGISTSSTSPVKIQNRVPICQEPMILQRLFTLKSENSSWISKQLKEAPGAEFPDISSIDGYLRHWGNHECIAYNRILPQNRFFLEHEAWSLGTGHSTPKGCTVSGFPPI
ncbi:hypothetical protein Tco_0707848 [Tanacetum coccineum]